MKQVVVGILLVVVAILGWVNLAMPFSVNIVYMIVAVSVIAVLSERRSPPLSSDAKHSPEKRNW
jgi:hypothetical protein